MPQSPEPPRQRPANISCANDADFHDFAPSHKWCWKVRFMREGRGFYGTAGWRRKGRLMPNDWSYGQGEVIVRKCRGIREQNPVVAAPGPAYAQRSAKEIRAHRSVKSRGSRP